MVVVGGSLLDRLKRDRIDNRMGQCLIRTSIDPDSRQLSGGEGGICVAFGVYRDDLGRIICDLAICENLDVWLVERLFCCGA